ncbi:MAG TPA: ComEC/Rec2 family competence protein, partial [Elusimicrobiota bacterium]|nr:ComEC/Rec2 family competence protein [Elusimicrobiota bacterium]
MEARPLPYFFRRPLLMVVAAAVFGAVVFRAWVPPRLPPDDAAHYADGEDAILRGTLASDPDFDGQKHRFVLRVRSVQKEGMRDPLPASGLVRVGVADAWFPAGWGDSVALKGPFFRPSAASAPGGFDYRAFLQEKNIHSQMSVFPGGWRRVRRASAASPRRWVGALRDRFFSAYGRRLSPHGAALMSGLVLGKKPASYPAVEDDFRRSGTYHLLVASGSNVGFVIGLWFFVARWLLFLPRRAIWGSAVGWAFLYAGLAGMDPPVVRAALMVSLGIAGYLLAREDRVEQAVGFSMGVFLLLRPRALFEAGFQMSYAATLGVVLAVPALEERLSGAFRESGPRFW